MGPQEYWDIDENYRPPEYVLAGGQREFIISTDSQIYSSEKTPADAIEQKAAHLQSRFQDLFDDVALLKHGGFLSATSWEEIASINPRNGILSDEEVFFTREESTNPDIQFGFALGSLIRTLQETAQNESDWTDVAWGFVLGFVGAPDRGAYREQKQLRDFEREIDRRKKEREQLAPRQSDGIDFFLKKQEEGRETINEVLENHNIRPFEPTVDWTYTELRSRGHPITRTLVNEFLEEEINQTTLESVDELYMMLITDAETIEEKGYTNPDVEAAEVLRSVSSSTTDISSSDIANAVSSPKSNVTGILYRLAETAEKESWTSYPVVKGDPGGWRMSAYGEIISEILFEISKSEAGLRQKNPATWIYDFALDPERIDDEKQEMIENMLQEIQFDIEIE